MTRYLVFGMVALALLLYSINISSLSVAFPHITSDFDTTIIIAGWVLSVYQLAGTAAMPLAGKAGDTFGSKNVFIVTTILFTLGSFLSAIAPNIYLLILFRFIQSVGGGSFMPVAAGIVAELFPKSRQQAIGLFSTILPTGALIGPNLGAWMTESFGWRSIFWVNIPFGIIVLVASAILISSKRKGGEAKMDLAGAGLFTAALFAIMFGLSELGARKTGVPWQVGAVSIALGILFIIYFLRHEKRTAHPVIDMPVLREKPFAAANLYNFLLGANIFGIASLLPLYAVSVYGMSTLASGLVLTPRSVGMAVTSAVTSAFLTRWGYRKPMLFGTALVITGLVILGFEPSRVDILGFTLGPMPIMLFVMLLFGVGLGMAAPAANNACIDLMPQRVATITGVRGMFRQSGGATGIAVFAMILDTAPSLPIGFAALSFGVAALMLLSGPAIFAMPASPETPAPGAATKTV